MATSRCNWAAAPEIEVGDKYAAASRVLYGAQGRVHAWEFASVCLLVVFFVYILFARGSFTNAILTARVLCYCC